MLPSMANADMKIKVHSGILPACPLFDLLLRLTVIDTYRLRI